MKHNLTVEKNDPRLCIAGTENLWSVCRRQECGNVTVSDVIAENIEHYDALIFAAAPEMLEALQMLMPQEPQEADSYDRAMWDAARTAIAKARGEA